MGIPGIKYFQMGVRGQIHIIWRGEGVLDMKMFENH